MGPRQTATRPRPRPATQGSRKRPPAPQRPRNRRPASDYENRRPLYWRILTNSFTIIFVAVAVLAVVIYNVSFGKGAPPPAAANNADLSLNDAIALVSHDYVTPAEAAGIAAAKKRAHEEQVRAERAARERAKRLSAAAKKRAAARAKAKAKAAADAVAREVANAPNPSSAQNQTLGKQMNAAKGWGGCWPSLLQIWTHESHWNERAHNPSSGAHGIPQALPGSKMASAGPNWQTNSATQIAWGLSYIKARYTDPCGAWSFWQSHHWY
ncbi:MAG TPA: lytic transglycosylase domain-containing protein [Streptosporangiaceae bacterium]|jgi:hypothetical protein